MLDRISHLPHEVIDIILSYVQLHAAVRTSTLSKKWRIHWTRAENLVLDRKFFDYIFRGQQEYVFCRHLYDDNGPEGEILESKYVRIVGNILLSHNGPIHKCTLYVPIFFHSLDAYNLWILAVLQNGVQDLTLHFERRCCQVPSFVFQCMELKHLSLMLINLERSSLPHNFGELYSLLSLDLHFDEISLDLLTHIFLNCPLLERLSLRLQHMDGSCAVNASELKVLYLASYTYPNFILINTPYLSTVSLEMRESYGVGDPDMLDFFGAVPKLGKLTLTGAVLQSQIRGAENLGSLRTVRVTQRMGKEPEIDFIELILTRSYSQIISSDAEIKMMTDIMLFRRASTQAEIIYSSRSSLFPAWVSSIHV